MSRFDPLDTIAAIASPPGAGSRGLIRVSGPEAFAIVLSVFVDASPAGLPVRSSRREGLIQLDGLGSPLSASVLFWPGSRTYTGQPLVEISMIGSRPLLRLVLASLLGLGARLAEPGEFTLRAFLWGRIDLTQSEAVLGVIDARTPEQLDAALVQLAGGLAGPIERLRDRLLDQLAHLEANLDFDEEPDVEALTHEVLASSFDEAAVEIQRLADRLDGRDLAVERPRVVLVGSPNAGKSRLFNALVGEEQAIVSPWSGTTRDYLTAPCDCDGLIVELVDTAGMDDASTSIESKAQGQRASQFAQADLRLACVPSDEAVPVDRSVPERTLVVRTKSDLAATVSGGGLSTSAATGEGLEVLKRAIATALAEQGAEGHPLAATAVRCRDALERASQAVASASQTLRHGTGAEFVAVDLRQAVDDLGRVVGAVVTDDILDRIFKKFCIGK